MVWNQLLTCSQFEYEQEAAQLVSQWRSGDFSSGDGLTQFSLFAAGMLEYGDTYNQRFVPLIRELNSLKDRESKPVPIQAHKDEWYFGATDEESF